MWTPIMTCSTFLQIMKGLSLPIRLTFTIWVADAVVCRDRDDSDGSVCRLTWRARILKLTKGELSSNSLRQVSSRLA